MAADRSRPVEKRERELRMSGSGRERERKLFFFTIIYYLNRLKCLEDLFLLLLFLGDVTPGPLTEYLTRLLAYLCVGFLSLLALLLYRLIGAQVYEQLNYS